VTAIVVWQSFSLHMEGGGLVSEDAGADGTERVGTKTAAAATTQGLWPNLKSRAYE
jgi:hypothetical protein